MFVPPNPNELLNAYEIFFSIGFFGIKFIFVVSIGLSKLRVAGKILLLIDIIEKIDSTLPAAPRRWPIDDLVELTSILCLNSLEIAFSSISSPFIVDVP